MIMKCMCEHKGQDEIHGKHKRVFNKLQGAKQGPSSEYRCTVCKRVKSGSNK